MRKALKQWIAAALVTAAAFCTVQITGIASAAGADSFSGTAPEKRSQTSATREDTAHKKLEKPVLEYHKSGDTVTVTWEDVPGNAGYEVSLALPNGEKPDVAAATIAGNKLELSLYFSAGSGDYTVSVTAKSRVSGYDSDPGKITYTHTEILKKPDTPVLKGDKSSLAVRWNAVPEADHYAVYLNGSVYSSNTSQTRVTFDKSKFAAPGKYTVSVKAVDQNDNESGISNKFVICEHYLVTFDYNGGKEGSIKERMLDKGADYGSLPDTARRGYKFKGWYTAKSGGDEVTDESSFSSGQNQTVYARWKKLKVSAKVKVAGISQQKGNITIRMAGQKKVSGYFIYCSNSKSMKGQKKIKVTSRKPYTFSVIKKLPKSKIGYRNYYRVRAYILDSTGKKVWGAYSRKFNITYRPN